MNYEDTPTTFHAKASCYNCLSDSDGINFDASIEYEGSLFLCLGCISDAAQIGRMHRARKIKLDRAEKAKQRAAVQAERDALAAKSVAQSV